MSQANKENKFTNCIQHVCPQVHDIFDNRTCLISWRISTQWGPLLLKEGGMIQVDIGDHPLIPFGPAPSILAAFHIQHNLLFLASFRVLHSQSRFGALMIQVDIGGHSPIPFELRHHLFQFLSRGTAYYF